MQYCNKGSIIPVTFICHGTKDLLTVASNQIPDSVSTGVGGSGVSGALVLQSSVLAGDFTLPTNLSVFR
jgi:hypothetical protein